MSFPSVLMVVSVALLMPVMALAQAPWSPLTPSESDETAAASIVGPNAVEPAEVLPDGSWVKIEVVNEADCDVELRLRDISGLPTIPVPAGTAFSEDYGAIGGYLGSSAELHYMSGETCSSGQVYVRGVK